MLVPEIQEHRAEALAEGERFGLLHRRHRFIAPLEIVVWDARSQVVDVMVADVPAEPLQHPGQLVERAPGERGLDGIPALVLRPIYVLVLVLHVEKPDAEY